MMLTLNFHKSFKQDLKRVLKGKYKATIRQELDFIVKKLLKQEPLLPKHKEHQLYGNWVGYRECHIKPDLLLIYKITTTELVLVALGSHSYLFNK